MEGKMAKMACLGVKKKFEGPTSLVYISEVGNLKPPVKGVKGKKWEFKNIMFIK